MWTASQEDTWTDYLGQELQATLGFGAQDVPRQDSAQARAEIGLEALGDLVWIAGGGEDVDQVVVDQLCTCVETALEDGPAHALELLGVGAGGGQDDRLDAMDVVREDVADCVSGVLRVSVHAEQDVAGQVDLGGIAAS